MVIFQLYGERTTLDQISTKIGVVKGAHDVIILPNFGFNIFRGITSTGVHNLHLPILSLLVIVTTVLPLPRSL